MTQNEYIEMIAREASDLGAVLVEPRAKNYMRAMFERRGDANAFEELASELWYVIRAKALNMSVLVEVFER